MSNDQRLQIFPTRMNLQTTKARLKSAEKGYTLLKRKSDALQKRYKETEQELNSKKIKLRDLMNDAYLCLSECEFLGANFNLFIHEAKKKPSYITVKNESVSGVTLHEFKFNCDYSKVFCLDRATMNLQTTRKKLLDIISFLCTLASLESSFKALDEVVKSVNRRVNALEFMVVPKLTNTITYINAELDELDREEFFRLKKIQNLKKDNESE